MLFENTLKQTHIWLAEISDEIGDPDQKLAYHALRGVLHALRDRLPVDEAAQFAAELPMLVRGIYYEGYRSVGKPLRMREPEEIYERVQKELDMAGGGNAEAATRAVMKVLRRRMSEGELKDAQGTFPPHLKRLFPVLEPRPGQH